MKVLGKTGSEPRACVAVFDWRQYESRLNHAFGEAMFLAFFRLLAGSVSARVGAMAGVAIAFAAACTLAASAVLAAEPEPGMGVAPAPPAPLAAYGDTDLRRLFSSAPELTVAGEQLNVGLLRRFYARHGFAPVWTATRLMQASSLVNAVLHAGDHGLSPELFHANLLRVPATLTPLDRELLLSDAVLSYADALARGFIPIERRPDDEVLTPQPIDVAAVLDRAIDSPDPAAVIEGLAPTTPTYLQLRQALENLKASNAVGRTASTRLRQIEVNLERERWLPRPLPADRVWVNVADERLVLYRNNWPVFSTRVIVGQDERRNQSPEFQTAINAVLFNPPWNVPQDIAANEILPKTASDPGYLARHNMVVLPDGVLQQRAGPNSGLGQLMFDMRNRFDVYLHDTPSKNLFAREDRRISHGCIRVEKPRELAALLMQQPIEAIDQVIATGDTTRTDLPTPVPVFVVYETAFADADGRLQFRPDVYGRDAEVWEYLDPERGAVAEREPSGQRGG